MILASESPRRKELLESAGLTFRVIKSEYNEEKITDLNPAERVKKIAFGKANAIYKKGYKNNTIIAADTIVYQNPIFFGKPKNEKDIYKILSSLSNNYHEVYTGVCIFHKRKLYLFYDMTTVYFKEITKNDIKEYIKTGEPYGKAGAYAIQGYAKKFVNYIDGDINTVLGLPLSKVLGELRKIGAIS